MANALAKLLGYAAEPIAGGGMVDNARKTLGGRGYQIHVEEAKANGEKPMTPEQYAKTQGKA